MFTQIYSIQTAEEALACVAAGADYFGLAADSGKNLPAELTLPEAKKIFDAAGERIGKIAITVADGPEDIYPVIQYLTPDVIHLCGNSYYADAQFVRRAKELQPGIEVLQAIPMVGPEAIDQAVHFAQFCDRLILDSVDPAIAGIGAAGTTHDWAISREICRRLAGTGCKVILAGGLGPDNVADAIRQVRPDGVDSFTRTSRKTPDGSRKDPELIAHFVKNAMDTARELGL